MPLFHYTACRVAWPDTDPAGVAWFGTFFRYFESAEEELFLRLGHDRFRLLQSLHILMPRTSTRASFRSPARLGDQISIGAGVVALSDRRIEFAFDVHEHGTGRLICEASYRTACVDAATFAARTFPREMLDLLAQAKCEI